MRNVRERWCNRGFPRLLPYKMNKRMFVITQTTAVHKFISVVCCSFSARIYRPLPGLKSSNADFFGFSSPEPCIRFLIGLLHLIRELNLFFIRCPPPVGSLRLHSLGATAHGISLRFNAQPVTMQKYHYCCRMSWPHRMCLTVSAAVAQVVSRAVPHLALCNRKVREKLLLSCKCSRERG